MKASEFDKKFDDGENVLADLDTARAQRPGEESKRINVDFPAWMVASLDREARHRGCDAPIHYQDLACGTPEAP